MPDTPSNLTIGPVRVAFPNLFTPKESTDGGDPKYNLTVLIPKTPEGEALRKKLNDLAIAAVNAKWPDPKTRPAKLQRPIHDGDSGEDTEDGKAKGETYDGFAGHFYLSASSKRKPAVLDTRKQPIPKEREDDIYGGCWLWINVNAYAYDNRKKGVAFGLNCVMKARDDDAFGGSGVSPDQAFADIKTEDGASVGNDEDPFSK